MNEQRAYASLSSGLLARKGAAKPAMRPQGFGQFGASLEDLGWNDMGQPLPQPEAAELAHPVEHVPSSIAALTPLPHHGRPAAEEIAWDEEALADLPEPAVVEQQRAIAESFAPAESVEDAPRAEVQPEPAPEPVVALPRRRKQVVAPTAKPAIGGRKAAFTLRLDAERHLKLRLASAVDGRSAQQIVTQALDDYLATLPELDALAGRVPAGVAGRS